MVRRVAALAAVALLSVTASSALAADTTKTVWSEQGSGVAFWTFDENLESLPPGVYYYGGVSGGSVSVAVDGVVSYPYAGREFCFWYVEWTRTETDIYQSDSLDGCATPDVLTVDPQVKESRLVVSIPACPRWAWDYADATCAVGPVATFAADLVIRSAAKLRVSAGGGTQPPELSGSRISSGGRYFYRESISGDGTGALEGTVTLDGTSLLPPEASWSGAVFSSMITEMEIAP